MMAGEYSVVTLVAPPPVASMPLIVPRAQIITSQDHANILHSQGRGRVAVARRINGRRRADQQERRARRYFRRAAARRLRFSGW